MTAMDLPVVVSARTEAASVVVALLLAPVPGGQRLPEWTPRAHVDVDVPGSGPTRQYSLCGLPGATVWRIAVLREQPSGGGSQ